ncbi:hypothetical protein CBI38_29220 [Rhodococcus oxybenzonivorans]|uniref:DUF732 domain-containing protein n=1 Tax=Rhodococcus oxybenzonivorans TaxID=1990687 RepID=A0A2S2C4Y8_9NOCA|nr:hypothetical protein [Rhodococcus oxybenzonivorans]AWK75919.1 hypothetical protein CBI38_29220 [Rhodococcus oxybenzonivorans]
MRRFASTLLVVLALCAVAVALFYFTSRTPQDTAARPMEDKAFMIDGRPMTCRELFPPGCDFDLQYSYNRWGERLESFVDTSDLGPYARDIGFAASAKLSLQACRLSETSGKTILEFVELARRDHPEADSPQVFPVWNRARQFLCPGV